MMPTYAQLRTEPCWLAQVVPPGLQNLVNRLEDFYAPGVTNIGAYGDNRHLRGYHRSRRWILESRFCTSRGYSIVETSGNRSGGDSNWIAGVDILAGYGESRLIWDRVNLARQHGTIIYLVQVLLERDPWHVHLSFDRAWPNEDHTRLFHIITGTADPKEDHVSIQVDLPELSGGSSGTDVITAQSLLGARGFATAVDGDFGPHTDEQTRAMQARYGAEAIDGIWGPETWTIAITGEDRL